MNSLSSTALRAVYWVRALRVGELISTRKQLLAELIVLGSIVVATFSSLLLVAGQVARVDFVVAQSPQQAWQAFSNSFYAWSRSSTVGDQATAGAGTLYYLLQAALIAFLGTDFASKILFILPVPLSGVCMLALGHKQGWSFETRLIAAVIYIVNPYVQSRLLNGHYDLLIAYALLPLALSAYISAVNSPTLSSITKAGMLITFQFLFSASAPGLVLTVGAMLLYSSLQVVVSVGSRRSEVGALLLANVKTFVGTLVVCVALNQFILLPVIWSLRSGSGMPVTGIGIPIEYLEFESQNTSILNVMRLTGWFGYIFNYSPAAVSLAPTPLPPALDFPLFSWLWQLSTIYVPFLVLVSLLATRGRWNAFTGSLSLIASFLAKGVQRPLGVVYSWLFTFIPGFIMFRENTKFLVLLSFSFAILAGQGAHYISSRVRPKRRCVCALLTLMLIFPIIFSNWPAFTGNFQGQIHPFTVPRDMLETQEFLSQQSGDFRTIWLPLRLGTTEATWFNWTNSLPMIDPVGSPASFPKPIVGVNQGQFSSADNFIAFVYATLYENRTSHIGQLLALLNVRFVMLRSDVLDTNGIMPREWETLYKILRSQEDLILRRQFGAIYVFENMSGSSHISISNRPALVFGDWSATTSLSDVPGLRLADMPMFFVDDISSMTATQIKSMSPTFVWANKLVGVDDLAMSLTDASFFVEPSRYAKSSIDPELEWIKSTSNYLSPPWLEWKSFLDYPYRLLSDLPPRSLAVTRGTTSLQVPFHVDLNADHDIWIRTFQGKEEGDLRVVLDDSVRFTLQQRANSEQGLVWTKLGTVRLSVGEHHLVLRNLSGLSVIDRVAIIPTYQYQATQIEALEFLSGPDTRNVVLLRGIDAERTDQLSPIALQDGGSALENDTLKVVGNGILGYDFFLPKSGKYSIAILSQSAEPIRLSLYQRTFLTSGGAGLRWIYPGTMYLPAGRSHLTVGVTGSYTAIEKIIIYADNNGQGEIGVLGSDNGSPPLSYGEVDPTSYAVSFASSSESIVVFSERYEPNWLLYGENGGTSTPALVFGFANAYFVRGGSYVLRFEIQKYVSLGFQLSTVAVLLLTMLVVVNTGYWRRLRGAAPCA